MEIDIRSSVRACPNGHEASSVHEFCPRCGERLVTLAPFDAATSGEYDRSNGNGASHTRSPLYEPVAEPRRRRSVPRIAIIAAVAVAVLGAAIIIPKVFFGGPDSKLTAAFDRSTAIADPVFVSFSQIQSLSDVNAAGASAVAADAQLRSTLLSIAQAGSTQDRAEVKGVLDPLGDLMGGLAQLASIDGKTLGKWDTLEPRLTEQVKDIEQAVAGISVIEKPSSAWLGNLNAALAALDRLIEKDQALVAEWKASSARSQSRRTGARKALDAYVADVQPLIDEYSQLRTAMGNFSDEVAAGGYTWDRAYAFLANAATERARIKASLDAIQAPAALEGAHETLVNVIDRSVAAVKAASEGLSQCQGSYYCYSYQDTPGWQTFRSESGSISAAYSRALDSWKSAVAREKTKLSASTAPAFPTL